ncbi:MAG TPA: DUF4139 domain-containing protein, partial [Polyangiales bacterium]|nr:DUF4139 domain-containing protein [Polyangiales bacterium]
RPYSTTDSLLALSRVVLYRNGVGYFERAGVVDGDRLTLKVRKDQIDDLLKSLTVVDRSSHKTISISIPLDPKAWQDAALSMLAPGRGRLAEVLDALRGSYVGVDTDARRISGRIVMVERVAPPFVRKPDEERPEDHKLTVLNGDTFEVVLLSKVNAITFREGDLVMQLERHLDATAGEGMFQQVEVVAHFADRGKHDLAVSYVAEAPLWKPTYRLVLAEDGSGQALLQAWAVVSNISGESWQNVQLSLTAGAPLAFRYDLHTPQDVPRPDLTQSGVDKHVQVTFGESTQEQPLANGASGAMPATPAPAPPSMLEDESAPAASSGMMREMAKKSRSRALAKPMAEPAIDMLALAASQTPTAAAKQVAGLTRFDIGERVSLPDGSASMVQLINQLVPGEQTFLFKPGGAGQGYEYNPYRVVRFKNATDFVLEPGPISIYAGGSFVGEGLSEAIASHDQATIPFAAEPSITIHSNVERSGDAMKVQKIVRGVIEVESFERITTVWTVEAKPSKSGTRVLVRQPRASDAYHLIDPPKDTETLADGYFIPITVSPDQKSATLSVVEQTPSKLSLDIWNDRVPELLSQLLAATDLDKNARAKLEPIVNARQRIGRIDTELEGLSAQQDQIDERANEERENLLAIQKDP